jgi:GAF domain-containing protein
MASGANPRDPAPGGRRTARRVAAWVRRRPRTPPPPLDPAAVLAALRAESTIAATLDRIVMLVRPVVPGCTHASVTLPSAITPVATDGLARRLDAVQYAAADGPCLDALRPGVLSLSADLAAEERWADFSAAAVQAGIRGVLSCRLALGDGTLGSLNLYASEPGAFGPAAVPAATAYARQAAAALGRAARREDAAQLRRAVASDRIPGAAIGLLMGARNISEAEAFDLLRSTGRRTDRALRDVAADVVSRGATIGGGPIAAP